MAATDSPPIGLDHATANPHPDPAPSARGRSERCECNDCDYTVPVDEGLPSKCPECDGALVRTAP